MIAIYLYSKFPSEYLVVCFDYALEKQTLQWNDNTRNYKSKSYESNASHLKFTYLFK